MEPRGITRLLSEDIDLTLNNNYNVGVSAMTQIFKRFCIVCEKRMHGAMGVDFNAGVNGGTQVTDTPGYGSRFDSIATFVFCVCDDCLESKGKKGFIAITKVTKTNPKTEWALWDGTDEDRELHWSDSEYKIDGDASDEDLINTINQYRMKIDGWGRYELLDDNDTVVYGFNYRLAGDHADRRSIEASTIRELISKIHDALNFSLNF